MYCIELDINQSSLISMLEYYEDREELTVHFHKYFTDKITYYGVPEYWFIEFSEAKSFGKFYLTNIKNNFKTKKMADKPKTKNQCKTDGKRFIKMSIDVTKINKEWLHVGEKGTYLGITLMMLPDGTLDNYGNLGMVVQDVPEVIRKKEMSLPKNEKSSGAILGNGAEFDWDNSGSEGAPGKETGTLMGSSNDMADDLPF